MWEEIMVTFFMGSFMESAMGSIMAWVMRLTPRSVMDLFIMLVMESAIRSVMGMVMESIMESVMQSAASWQLAAYLRAMWFPANADGARLELPDIATLLQPHKQSPAQTDTCAVG